MGRPEGRKPRRTSEALRGPFATLRASAKGDKRGGPSGYRPQGDKKGGSGRQKREALRAIALRASAQGDKRGAQGDKRERPFADAQGDRKKAGDRKRDQGNRKGASRLHTKRM